jgi:hypothetical protein
MVETIIEGASIFGYTGSFLLAKKCRKKSGNQLQVIDIIDLITECLEIRQRMNIIEQVFFVSGLR